MNLIINILGLIFGTCGLLYIIDRMDKKDNLGRYRNEFKDKSVKYLLDYINGKRSKR